MKLTLLHLALAASTVVCKDIWIQVGANTTNDASSIFQPDRVTASLGDTVWFNFTSGNHTAIESLFSSPCIPAHEADITQNGFNSGFQSVSNGTAASRVPVPITAQIENKTMWFFDYNTCKLGGVGVINSNESSTETLDGFRRNAIRLNGTDANATSTSSGALSTATGPSGTASGTGASATPNSAEQRVFNAALTLPLTLLLFGLVSM